MKHSHKLLLSFIFVSVALFLLPSIIPDFYFVSNYNEKMISKITSVDCFAAAGDTHIGFSNGSYLKWMLDDASERGADFVIVNGDLTQEGTREEYDAYLNIIANSDIPVISTLGNHDLRNEGKTHYTALFGDAYFDFKVGDSNFIFLDTSKKYISSKQYRWLERQLKQGGENIIFSHVPIEIPAEISNTEYAIKNPEKFLERVQEQAFIAHTHEAVITEDYIFIPASGGKILEEVDKQGYYLVCTKNSSKTLISARNQ